MGEFLGGQIWLSPGKEPLTAGAAQQQRQDVPGTGMVSGGQLPSLQEKFPEFSDPTHFTLQCLRSLILK